MTNVTDIIKGYKNPESRWARFGPYYAMFPVDFAFKVVKEHSKKGEHIIDPFAGRCSSIYAGGVLGRQGLGIEINPVGWLYGKVKLQPADKKEVKTRLFEVYSMRNYFSRSIKRMPLFYRMCYCDEVLKFLLAARKHLDWKNNSVDATLMSILLVYLHGKLGEGMSNQMRMTKAMGMNYSVKWWKKKKLPKPPEINPIEFVIKKLDWRYKKGIPSISDNSKIIFGDSTVELEKIVKTSQNKGVRYSLLFTSPPYCSVTDYYADQWLRLWLLGESEIPKPKHEKYKGRFVCRKEYYDLLDNVFKNCAALMDKKSTVYVRTDRREFTFHSTFEILRKHFPKHKVNGCIKSFKKKTQTNIFGNSSAGNGEVDIIMSSR